ncbi:hypothetical protein LMG18101_02987 [Ralstonia flaminis]|uniref:Lipoprotein n=1 Tax=Ralstonia flaminis TaxID=3058597 RepID=A0ABN9JLJ6_9RALS|nr:hypothetical protein LMG18101_02987 [Ralstonia sp. LMG 18101]
MRAVIYTVMGIWIAALAGCLWVPDGGYHDARQGGYENGQHGGYGGDREDSRDHEHH